MNTLVNASLQTIATGLVALGAFTIKTDLMTGTAEIALGLIAYLVYEMFPPSPTV